MCLSEHATLLFHGKLLHTYSKSLDPFMQFVNSTREASTIDDINVLSVLVKAVDCCPSE